MTETMGDIDQALRELPLHTPRQPAWDQIATQLEGYQNTAERRSRWLWSSGAVLLVILNGLFFWPVANDGNSRLPVADVMGYDGNLYNTEQALQVAVLKRRIAQLDQLLPYGNLDEQLQMYQYRNELSDRLERVGYQPSDTGIKL